MSLILALLALPLAKVPGTIGAGFSGTFSSLGIVIILGAMIGFFLERPAPRSPWPTGSSAAWATRTRNWPSC